jgi:hypothetical protein
MSVRARRPALANVGGDTVVVAQACGGTADVLAVRGNPPQARIGARASQHEVEPPGANVGPQLTQGPGMASCCRWPSWWG